MKYILIIYMCLCSILAAQAQCPATDHKLVGPFVTQTEHYGDHDNTDYTEEDLCDGDGWLLVFEDDFNGTQIDESIWQAGFCNSGTYNDCPPFNTSPCYVVSGGSLFLTSEYEPSSGKTWNPTLITKRKFPAGKVLVRAKLPPIPDVPEDLAPLWMRSTLDYTDPDLSNGSYELASGNHQYYANEMDIEFFNASRSIGTYTLWDGANSSVNNVIGETLYKDDNSDHHGNSQAGHCYNGNMSDGNWHIFEIEWDMYHVDWYVDDILVNSFSRTYEPVYLTGSLPIIPIPIKYEEVSECSGAPVNGLYAKDWMFPLFANFPITISGLGAYDGYIPQASLPYTEEIDYVQAYRKITCDKDLILPPTNLTPLDFRSAGGINCDRSGGDQVPPTIDNQTPSVITGGTITVAAGNPYVFKRDDYDYSTQQNLDLYATQDIVLLPGFETNLLYQANGPCSLPPYGPHINSGETFGNNWTIQDVFTAQIAACPPSDPIKPHKPAQHSDIPEPVITNFSLSLYPNPSTTGQCTVQFSMSADADVTIGLVDITGREVATLDHSWHSQGTSFVPFSTESYAPGVYTVRFSDGTNISTQRLTIAGK